MHDLLYKYRQQILDSYLLINKLIDDEIQNFAISSGEDSYIIRFSYKQWEFEVTKRFVTERTLHKDFKRYDDTFKTTSGLDKDAFFNVSMQRDICVFLKSENISILRSYIQEVSSKYFKLKKKMEHTI